MSPERRRLAPGLLKRSALWIVPSVVVWLLVTPVYNQFLIGATENLVRMTESPDATRLAPQSTHYMAITRTDRPTSDGILGSVRVIAM